MEFIPVPNVGQFNMCYAQQGNQLQNVFHLLNDSPFDQVSLALACEVLKTWWNDNCKQNASSDLSLVRIIARALDTEGSPAMEYTSGLPIAGTSAGSPAPANVTVAVKWGTAYAGRSYRGRTYVPGLVTAHLVGNKIAAAMVTQFTANYNALLTELDETPWKLVVVSRFHLKAPRETGVATEITSVFVNDDVDSQRRRLNGRGQ